MNKANVIKVRDTFKNAGVKVQVFGDNSNVYDERYDVLIWDDANELLYVIQRVKTQSVFDYSDPNNAAYYSVLEYEVIQYIQAISNFDQFKKILPEFGTVDAVRKEKIINWVAETAGKRINVKPGTENLLDIAKKDPKKFDAAYGKGAAENLVAEAEGNLIKVKNEALQDVINNITEKQIIMLTDNINESIEIPADKKVTLDLGGKTFSVPDNCGISVKGTLTIKDTGKIGKISCVKTPISVDGASAKLIIESGTINSVADYAIFAVNGGTVVVNGGSIHSKESVLSGNNTTGDMNFEVNGGILTAEEGPAVYMPGQGKLTITDGVLNGGISLRMGQVNISGGTINAIANNIDNPAEYYSYSGNAWLPDALYVFGGTYNSSNPEYGNSLNLNITGGTFNCLNRQGSAVAIYDLGKVAQTMNVNISTKAKLNKNAAKRNDYDVLSLEDIGVTNPKSGYNNPNYVGKVVTNYV